MLAMCATNAAALQGAISARPGRLPEPAAATGASRSRGPLLVPVAAHRAAAARRAASPVAVQSEGPQWTFDLSVRLRRLLYNTLSPLDRGDFRWEFLVPGWMRGGKTLNNVDKFIVCSTFIGISFTLQTIADPGASVGVHLSYIAQFFSYAMGDPIGFRLLAVLTSMLEIFGNLFEEKSAGLLVAGLTTPNFFEALRMTNDEDLFPIFYDELFIFINGYYVMRWFLNREDVSAAIDWTEEQEELYANCFAGLGFRRAQFSRLLRSASFERAGEKGDTLTVQDEPIEDLFVPLSSDVEVRVNGVVATKLPAYQLVGEASLLENLQSPGGTLHPKSRATVVSPPGQTYVRWPQSAFYELQQEEDSDFAYAIQLMIARQLSDKLKEARLSQRRAESALESVASSSGGDSAPPASSTSSGAAVEAQALLERSKRYERRIMSLEKNLDVSEKELSDVKAILVSIACLAGLVVAGLSEPLFIVSLANEGIE